MRDLAKARSMPQTSQSEVTQLNSKRPIDATPINESDGSEEELTRRRGRKSTVRFDQEPEDEISMTDIADLCSPSPAPKQQFAQSAVPLQRNQQLVEPAIREAARKSAPAAAKQKAQQSK
jgi:DNA mismatch repair protein MSH6